MTQITVTDLNNAKLDVDTIANIANSTSTSVTDRLGNTRRTLYSLSNEFPNASDNAAAALAAKNLAETARDAAFINADVYASTATGLAAVADGEQFQVVSGSEIIRYTRTNATTATEVARYPAAAAAPFIFRSSLPAGAALTTATSPGSYYGAPSSGFTDLPASFVSTDSFTLLVYDSTAVAGRYKIQLLMQLDKPDIFYSRRLDTISSGTTAWVQGATPATGSIIGAKLADGAITGSKLNALYSFKGTLTSANDANAVTSAGVYYCSSQIANAPAGSSTSGYLYADNFDSNYVVQVYRDRTNPANAWIRYMRPANAFYGAWTPLGLGTGSVATSHIADAAVTRAKLSNDFAYAGAIGTGHDANTITANGLYLATAQIANAPVGSTAAGYLTVENHNGGSYVIQTWRNLTNPSISWVRYIRPAQSVYGSWISTNAATASSPFAGKKIVMFGDSITEFGDYPARVATRIGATVTNMGFGGCRMAYHTGDPNSAYYEKMSMFNLARYINTGNYSELIAAADSLFAASGDDNRPQAVALSAIDWSTIDYITVAFGTNDFRGGVPLGAVSDSGGTSIRGAINYTVEKILSVYPHLKLAFITPPWRARQATGDGLESDANSNGNGVYLIEYADAIIDQAAKNHLPALDLYRHSGINKWNEATMLDDGLHPKSPAGYQLIADKVASFIASNF